MRALILFAALFCSLNTAFAQDPSDPCLNKLKTDPKLQVLFERFPYDVSKGQSLEVLSNNNKISDDDKVALSYLVKQGQDCFNLGSDWRSANYSVEMVNAISSYIVETLAVYSELYSGNITYGETARKRAKLSADLGNKIREIASAAAEKKKVADAKRKANSDAIADKKAQAIADQINRQEAEARAAEARNLEERRRAILQLMPQMQVQPNIVTPYQMPIPKQTRCQMIGNQMNCQTF